MAQQRSSAKNELSIRDRILPAPRTFRRWAFAIVLTGTVLSTTNACGGFDAAKDTVKSKIDQIDLEFPSLDSDSAQP